MARTMSEPCSVVEPVVDARPSGPSVNRDLEEIRRQSRLVDQMTSMQSTLRDWDRIVGTVLTCTVLVASLVGVAFAFATGTSRVNFLGITGLRSTWLGWLAVSTFSVTLLLLVLDPRGASRRREAAVDVLANIKDLYRVAPPPADAASHLETVTAAYRQAMADVPAVPNILFNPLKAAHTRKVEISRLLSRHPGTGYWTARRAVSKQAKESRQAEKLQGHGQETAHT